MENATKALLIAAAILIAIMIISLGLVVFNMGKETVSNINLNAQEIEAHNNKFTPYEGTSKRGNQVNALLNTVLTNNTTLTEDEAGQKVTVYDEVEKIEEALNNPSRPLVVILGGAKVKDKIGVIENAVKIADYVLIGGGMVYTFLKAMGYNIGLSIVDDESIVFCKKMLSENSSKIILPEDVVVAKSMTNESSTRLVNINGIMENEIGVDIGVLTISKYKTILSKAGTIIWNGPVGVFEIPNFSNGTRKLVQILSSLKAKIVIGGGDSVSALNKFGFSNSNAHISTGGGASLEMLEGKELPGLSAISDL